MRRVNRQLVHLVGTTAVLVSSLRFPGGPDGTTAQAGERPIPMPYAINPPASRIAQLFGLRRPVTAHSQFLVVAYDREDGTFVYDLFLIDAAVPAPTLEDLVAFEDDPAPLAAALRSWAICTATYESWGEYTTHEFYSDDGPTLQRFGTTYGRVTAHRTALCIPPLGQQIVVGHLSTATRVVQDDPLLIISYVGYFPLYFDPEIDLWARYSLLPLYYPVATKAHLLARELAGLPPTEPTNDAANADAASGSVAGGCLCCEAFGQCQLAAVDNWKADIDTCLSEHVNTHFQYTIACVGVAAGILALSGGNVVFAFIGGGLCLIGEAAIVLISHNKCLSAGRNHFSAAIRSCHASYLTCCAGSDDCPPTLAKE